MPLPLLYSFRRCPYAIRARLALRSAGIAYELKEVVLRNKPADLLALSPKGTVPVLRLPDRQGQGQVLEQSLDIMQWALRQADPQGWLRVAPLDEMLALILVNDTQFKPLLDRYKYPERHPEQSQAVWRQQAVDTMLLGLNQRLQQHPYLFGECASLADMAIVPFVRQFAHVDRDWWNHNDLGPLRTWLDKLISSSLFEVVMAKA